MKKFLIGLLAVSSVSVFAKATLIENPLHLGTGLPFTAALASTTANYKYYSNPYIPSDIDGVCRSLGYESASASTKGTQVSYSIAVDKDGNEIAGLKSLIISSIVCNGEQEISMNKNFSVIESPVHPSTGLKFSAPNIDNLTQGAFRAVHAYSPSSEKGICLSLGYDDVVPASSDYSISNWNVEKVVSVDDKGSIQDMTRTYTAERIICIKN